MPRWTKVFLVLFVVMLFIIAVLLMAGNYYLNKVMPPQQRAAAQAYLNQIVTIPPDWQQIKPFPPALVKMVYDADAEYQRLVGNNGTLVGTLRRDEYMAFNHLAAARQLTPDEVSSATDILAKSQALITVMKRISVEKDYDASVFRPMLPATDDFHEFVLMVFGTKLLCLDAYIAAKNSMSDEGLSSSLAALRLARRHPASDIITHLVCVSAESISCQSIESIADTCETSDALHRALEEMDRLSPLVNLDNLAQGEILDVIGGLRSRGREGYPVNLQSGLPMSSHFESLLLANQNFDDWALSNLPPTDARILVLQRKRASGGGQTANRLPINTGFQLPLIGNIIRENFALIARPNLLEAVTRERTAQVRFELARVAIARSLAKIQAGDKATSETMSGLLGHIPQDPFGKGAMVEETTRTLHFHSLGPDGVDDRAQIPYDPTNGTISRGNIN